MSLKKLCDQYKLIHDKLHGYIPISIFAKKIIDTRHFQRLRELNQLGTCKYVFPNAVHTRFEHSIGTYYMADKILNTIIMYTDPNSINDYLSNIIELKSYYEREYSSKIFKLDKYVCELIKIAALCHDIGHGPFSHVFDDFYLPLIGKSNELYASHEERSGLIIDLIIKSDESLCKHIGIDEIQFIKNLINPTKEHTGFIYQIVSNNVTGLDVDKFDYLMRDIEMINFQAKIDVSRLVEHIRIIKNQIVYPEQAIFDIYNLFQTRHRLHIQIYSHSVTISIQYLIVEIFKLMDEFIGIADSIYDMNKFCDMTEGYILHSVKTLSTLNKFFTDQQNEKINKALKLINDLDERRLYPTIYSFKSKEKLNLSDILKDIDYDENIIVYQRKVGFVSGDKPNPFNDIYVYKTKDTTKMIDSIEIFKNNKDKITMLMTDIYQEYINVIFYKDRLNHDKILFLRNHFKSLF